MTRKELEADLAEWLAFAAPEQWRRNYKGNCVRQFRAFRCTIVWIRGGGYRWCWMRREVHKWSDEKFTTERQAIAGLAAELFALDLRELRAAKVARELPVTEVTRKSR